MGKGVDLSRKKEKRAEKRAIQIRISEESRLQQVHHDSWCDQLDPMNEELGLELLGIGVGDDQQLGDAIHRQHVPGDADPPLDRPPRPDEVVPPLGQPAPPGPAPPGPVLAPPEEAALPLGRPGGPAPPGPDEAAPPLGRPGGLAPERPAPPGPEEAALPLDRPDGPAPPDAPARLGAAPHGGPDHHLDEV